ncbi:MAG: TPM domain-containing protein [Muribaculaceae bacterium]|nr:TPM domain-containing protein [Muribaculaceae bacterium]
MKELKMTGRIIGLLLMILVAVPLMNARDYTPSEIENPNLADRRVYVSDVGNLVGAEARRNVNETLYSLRQKTGAEVVVAVVPSIGDMSIEEFSEKLFTAWGIGKSDKDNGVLILIAPEQRRARITTGYGVEGALPDISAKRIVERSIVANMKRGDLDAAVEASAADVAAVLSDPAVAEELRSSEKDAWERSRESDITDGTLLSFAGWVAFGVFMVALGLFIYDTVKSRRQPDRYHKALVWHHRRGSYWLLTLCSLGAALPIALLAEWKRRRERNKPLICPVCGKKMRKLSEEEDNAMLSASQDFEEHLKTVDYDVWVCPECGAVERFAYKTPQNKYTECPSCHTIAMCEVRNHTIVPATTRQAGEGEKIYECQFCHHQNRRRYVIPKRDDGAAAAVAAGAILGSMGRGSGSGGYGGGGFGGGFGGGSTGGGGASGGW